MLRCLDCDLLFRMPRLPADCRAICVRCGGTLFASKPRGLERAISLYATAFVLWVIANSFGFLTFELQGRAQPSRLASSAIQVATFDHWAGSLDDMIARVLVEDVAALLPRDRVVPFQSVSRPDLDYRAAIDVSRFDVDDAGEAVLLAGWQFYRRDGRAAGHVGETSARAQAASDGLDDRVAAMRRALGDLGAEIARAVLQLQAAGGG